MCWRIWIFKLLAFLSWCIVIVFVHHFVWLWSMLSSSKSLIMFKNNVSKQQPKSMMSLRNNYLPNMWWMFKHGLPTLLVKIFMLSDLPYSYSILKRFYCQPKKLGSTWTWISTLYLIWIFWICNLFFSWWQWSTMLKWAID